MVQAGVGLFFNTDLKIRFLPEQKLGTDSKIKMFGVGLMHDIKQYFPGVKSLPFDLSALVAYNSITGSTSLINTSKDPLTGYPNQTDGVPSSSDGKSTYTFNSWLFQALISKKISVLTFYGGIGGNSINQGGHCSTFTLDNPLFPDPSANPAPVRLKNPFSTTYKNNGMKLTAGMRLKLGPIYFSGDYTVQSYNVLTVGFGLAIR